MVTRVVYIRMALNSFQYKSKSLSSWVNVMRGLFLELPEDDGLSRIKDCEDQNGKKPQHPMKSIQEKVSTVYQKFIHVC